MPNPEGLHGNTVSREDVPDEMIEEVAGFVEDVGAESERILKEGSEQLQALPQERQREVALALEAVHRKIKETVARHKEAVYMYSRLLLFSGLVLMTPGEKYQDHRSLAERMTAAKSDIATAGITQEQRNAYIPGVNDFLQSRIEPVGYQITWRGMKETLETIIYGRNTEWTERERAPREDAWRMYLGIPQTHNTFGVSDFRPSRSKDDIYYYKINGFLEEKARGYSSTPQEEIRILVKRLTESESGKFIDSDTELNVMGSYTWSLGEDTGGHYISYHDKWDLDVPIEQKGFFGQPFEIYDRIYYDLDTYEPISR